MISKKYLVSIFSFVLLVFAVNFCFAFSGAGAGTLANPYNITNCTQLVEVDDNSAANYSLINNINFSSVGCEAYVQGNGWLPLGKMGGAFVGTFFGNNHVIYNLYIRNTIDNKAGLFGNASLDSDNYGKFYDIGLENVNITSNQSVGGLVGYGKWVVINNSYVTGEINGNLDVGGLVGLGDFSAISNSYSNVVVISSGDYTGGLVGEANAIEINNSFTRGNVVGESYSGGLIGSAINSIIYDSFALGDVNGTSMVGGLSGSVCCGSDPGRISRSYATGNVLGTSNWVGGLVGDGSDGIINMSFASGTVEGITWVGGLVGEGQNLTLYNSYATGDVTGSGYVGGLVGYLWNSGADRGRVNFSYSIGNVTGTTNVGGLIGNSTSSDVNYSYYDTNTSGKSDTGKGEPMTTLDMSNFALYLGDWDITTVNIGETDAGSIWNFNATQIYPFLNWEDILSPVVHLVAPLNDSTSFYAEVNHSFNVTDVSDFVSCTMYWDDFSEANSVVFDSVVPNGTIFRAGSLTSSDGNINWTVNCTDLAGNIGSSEIWSYLVGTVPQITSLSSGDPSTTSATISWTTSESSNASVSYGTSQTNLATRVDDTGFGLSQSIALTGLSASTLYYYNVTSCDSSGNCNTSGPNSFTTDAASSGGSSGGGGGGGGGGGPSVVSRWVKEIKMNSSDLNLGQTLKGLKEKYRITFNVSGMGHSVGILNISSSNMTIEVASTPQIATLLIGETKKFDVNADNSYDLLVSLISISNGTANVSIKAIEESYVPLVTETISGNTTGVSSVDDSAEQENSSSLFSYKNILIGVIVISILLAVFWFAYLKGKLREKKIEKAIRYSSKNN